jgi:hypothetical protein
MKLIGINGFKRSGKDTTHQIINEMRRNVARAAFADKLKIMAAMALGFEGTDAELIALMDECKESWHFEIYEHRAMLDPFKFFNGREYLQWFGGNARKVFGDSFWIDQVLPNPARLEAADWLALCREELYERYGFNTGILVVTDVRYPNEARRVLSLGGEVWEVVRPGLVSDGHDSEQQLARELITRTIDNRGDLDHLRYEVAMALGDG